MNIFEILFYLYITVFLLRFFIPNTGQMYFNRPFQFLVKATDPFSRKISSAMPGVKDALSHLICLAVFLFLQSLFYIDNLEVFMISGTSRYAPVEAIRFFYASDGLAASLHFCILKYLSFLFQFCLIAVIVVWTSYSQRISNHVLFIFHHFLNTFLARMLPSKWEINIYEKPFRSIAALFLFFSFFTSLILLAGAGMRIIALPPEGPTLLVLRAVCAYAVLIINVASILVPLLLIRIMLSWFLPDSNRISHILFSLTQPVLSPFKKLPLQAGFIDFSPFVAILFVIITLNISAIILNRIITAFL